MEPTALTMHAVLVNFGTGFFICFVSYLGIKYLMMRQAERAKQAK